MGELPRVFFPENVKVGAVFNYSQRTNPFQMSVTMVPERDVSPSEMARIKRYVERSVPKGEY